MVGARVKNQTLTRSSARTGKKVQRMDGFPRVLRRHDGEGVGKKYSRNVHSC